jgi:anti-sigma regulatory factor (Ser/Thr protein kinase)
VVLHDRHKRGHDAAGSQEGSIVADLSSGLWPAVSAAPAHYQPAGASIAAIPLCPVPASARSARDFTAAVLCAWGLVGMLPDARLVVSELVTNAVRYGIAAELPAPSSPAQPPRPIRLRLRRHPAALRCEVIDHSNVMPACLATDDSAEIGRGLSLVAAVSRDWGATPLPAGGKCVWADLRLPA